MANTDRIHTSHTEVRPEVRTEPRSGAPMAFIVGGLVVAVGIIAWIFFAASDGGSVSTTTPAGSDTSIRIDNNGSTPAPAGDTTNNITTPAPATETAPAPAETAPAAN